MQVVLRMLRPRNAGTAFRCPSGQYEIGRGRECHVRLGDPSVSRQHCLLRVTEQGAFVRDLGSRNGTVVGNDWIDGEVRLAHGDHLKIGPVVFVVHVSLADSYDAADFPGAIGDAPGETIDGGRTEFLA
jgi:pSer/pThr/pTyr-binding forkhead associated (FHA) protein